jgi:hypothetical protein
MLFTGFSCQAPSTAVSDDDSIASESDREYVRTLTQRVRHTLKEWHNCRDVPSSRAGYLQLGSA